ncbi:hypothetical protein, partial [Endobacterium cereale]|uniref:hypothetical protein n=1 Tax=Endobacterium cereale TaxID=2663029 RepID=UPI001AD95038
TQLVSHRVFERTLRLMVFREACLSERQQHHSSNTLLHCLGLYQGSSWFVQPPPEKLLMVRLLPNTKCCMISVVRLDV